MQRQPELIFELLREAPAGQAHKDGADQPHLLVRGQPAVLQAATHLRPRPTMPDPEGLGFHEGDTLRRRFGILQQQPVAQGHQVVFRECVEVRSGWKSGFGHLLSLAQTLPG